MDEIIALEGVLQRFPGKGGWRHVRMTQAQSAEYGPLVRSAWPALLPVEVQMGEIRWKGALMPIKDGPLFVVVPAKICRKHGLSEGDALALHLRLLDPKPAS